VILITREEADIFRKQMPQMHIAIVNRGKKNKHYYLEENRSTMTLLSELRDDPHLMPRDAKQQANKKRW